MVAIQALSAFLKRANLVDMAPDGAPRVKPEDGQ